uniref:Uncharacterized protein n=1 Tax=Romanomermis culicivorax TaxID=13658 RepID=A0A915HXZ7_ROMCU
MLVLKLYRNYKKRSKHSMLIKFRKLKRTRKSIDDV